MAIAQIFMASGDEESHTAVARLWSNLLIDGFFFFGIALAATFFLAVQFAAEAGWAVIIRRLLEAIGSFMPIGAVVLVIVFVAATMHWNHLFHWMDPAVQNEYVIESTIDSAHPEYTNDKDAEGAVFNLEFDEIIAGKSWYLNLPFFWFRVILFLGVWMWFWTRFRKRSLEEDLGYDRKRHFRNVRDAAIFLVFFGYSSSAAAWDWVMSIDTHWFSTLFGWYTFSGIWLSSMVVVTLLAMWLHKNGYLKGLNSSHLHDLGKWMFGCSFLWSYLFFSQFMLIWYSNIPEEVTYFQARIEHYPIMYWGMFAVNFIFPMIALMDRDNKRNYGFLTVIGLIILGGHWMDTYMMITPGTMHEHGHIGFVEIGMALGFLGAFIFVVLNTLTKAPLVTKNHPFYEESIHHEIH
ncbi:quinol:cytochrome C oxidoreductase [bacterium SCSIO 12741]|nr:quinol:cytochrome C oxidoreductase [bacterium SCSIO 12741]